MMDNYLALLRGINVGGKNKLPMKALEAMFVAAGCTDVQTYIQSGNVLFQAAPSVAADICSGISAHIARDFGCHVPIVLRSARQLRDITLHNPYFETEAYAETLHVLFLADLPSSSRIAELDLDRSPPDTFCVHGQEIYLRLPQGAARTKLTNAYFDTKLSTVSTQRNWRTVTTLLAMMAK